MPTAMMAVVPGWHPRFEPWMARVRTAQRPNGPQPPQSGGQGRERLRRSREIGIGSWVKDRVKVLSRPTSERWPVALRERAP